MTSWRRYRNALSCSALVLLAGCGQNGSPAAPANLAGANQAVGGEAVVAATTLEYEGLCEASAAAVLDEAHFAVASDDSETLAIYRRGQPRPVNTFRHSGVTDLEGAARIGNRILWLTSHSLNRDGEDKPKRKVLFATTIVPGPTLNDVGSHFTGLRERIASQLGIEQAALMPWLNIEGVAATPEGDMLIGLRRAPEGDARAHVLRIDDPFAPGGASEGVGDAASPARVWRLDLGGRGIRSLEWIGGGERAYLILAGPRQEEAGTFALFWWDGAGETVAPGPAVSFGDMAAEGLVAWGDGEIMILGDNEGEGPARCSEDADDPRPRRFPSLALRL